VAGPPTSPSRCAGHSLSPLKSGEGFFLRWFGGLLTYSGNFPPLAGLEPVPARFADELLECGKLLRSLGVWSFLAVAVFVVREDLFFQQ
jgi:hypothetical protein